MEILQAFKFELRPDGGQRRRMGRFAGCKRFVYNKALGDLNSAYKNFFEGRGKFPQFKKKGEGESFRYPNPKQFKLDQENGRVFLPKLGWMRYRKSREVAGELRNITITQSGGKWSMSVQTRRGEEMPVPMAEAFCGIDKGVASFAALDNGGRIEGPNSFKKRERRLAKYQRRMGRKVKGSSNWSKSKAATFPVGVPAI